MNSPRVSVAIAVLALVGSVLVAAPAEADRASGTYGVAGHVNAKGVAVEVFRSTTGRESGPFEPAGSTTSNDYWGSSGYFELFLKPGVYRLAVNEHPNGSVDSRVYGSSTWQDAEGRTVFEVTDHSVGLSDVTLPFRGGEVAGSVTDQCDNDTGSAQVEAYAADDPDPDHASRWAIYSLRPNMYRARAFAGPTKFRITAQGHESRWVGGDSFTTATPFTIAPDGTAEGPDVLLPKIFTPDATGHVTGEIVTSNADHTTAGGLVVRFYRSASGTPAGPWVLTAQRTSAIGGEWGGGRGVYDAVVPTGMYKVSVNDTADGSGFSRGYGSRFYAGGGRPTNDGSDIEHADTICVDTGTVPLGSFAVRQLGGTISGTVTDVRGEPVDGKVWVYSADSTGNPDEAVRFARVDGAGHYQVGALGGPTKLLFVAATSDTYGGPAEIYLPTWSGSTVDPGAAQTVTVDEGQSATVDVVVPDAPLTLKTKPKILDKPVVGRVVYGDGGSSSLDPTSTSSPRARKHYQWLRDTRSGTVVITGATSARYTPTGADLGHTLILRVTHVAPRSVPGVQPLTVDSAPSRLVRTKAGVRVSAKAGGDRRFTVKATITIPGRPRSSGTAYVSWIRLKQKGDRLYPTGQDHTVQTRYSRGALRLSVKVPKTGYWAYQVYVPDSKLVIAASRDSYLKVK